MEFLLTTTETLSPIQSPLKTKKRKNLTLDISEDSNEPIIQDIYELISDLKKRQTNLDLDDWYTLNKLNVSPILSNVLDEKFKGETDEVKKFLVKSGYLEILPIAVGGYGIILLLKDRNSKVWILKITSFDIQDPDYESTVGTWLYSGKKVWTNHGYDFDQIPLERNGKEFELKKDDKLLNIIDYYDVWIFPTDQEGFKAIQKAYKYISLLISEKNNKELFKIYMGKLINGQIPLNVEIEDIDPPDYIQFMLIELGLYGTVSKWFEEITSKMSIDDIRFYIIGIILQVTTTITMLYDKARFVHGDLKSDNVFIQKFKKSSQNIQNSYLIYKYPDGSLYKWPEKDGSTTVYMIGDFGLSRFEIIKEQKPITTAYDSHAMDLHKFGISLLYEIYTNILIKRKDYLSFLEPIIRFIKDYFMIKPLDLIAGPKRQMLIDVHLHLAQLLTEHKKELINEEHSLKLGKISYFYTDEMNKVPEHNWTFFRDSIFKDFRYKYQSIRKKQKTKAKYQTPSHPEVNSQLKYFINKINMLSNKVTIW